MFNFSDDYPIVKEELNVIFAWMSSALGKALIHLVNLPPVVETRCGYGHCKEAPSASDLVHYDREKRIKDGRMRCDGLVIFSLLAKSRSDAQQWKSRIIIYLTLRQICRRPACSTALCTLAHATYIRNFIVRAGPRAPQYA